jgi:hypothetical protein
LHLDDPRKFTTKAKYPPYRPLEAVMTATVTAVGGYDREPRVRDPLGQRGLLGVRVPAVPGCAAAAPG